MARLALLLKDYGFDVRGCDVQERFSSDEYLLEGGIMIDIGFDRSLLGAEWELVIYSSAYPLSTDILSFALEKALPIYSYPEFLALLSTLQPTYVVVGTHGKTTTTSVLDHLLGQEGEYWALYGSNLITKEGSARSGNRFALLEGCEYQDHFLLYRAAGALLLSVEFDHPDYFNDLEAVYASFKQLVDGIQPNGVFVYNNDQEGSRLIGEYARETRTDLKILSFGFDEGSDVPIRKEGAFRYRIDNHVLHLTVSANPLVLDHLGALVFARSIKEVQTDPTILAQRLASFGGVGGRLEYMGQRGGVLFFDDYAHHPSEIIVSLDEMRSRFPDKKILVLFTPHTSSRTHSLLSEFAQALAQADYLILQPTFASARKDEEGDPLLLYNVLTKKVDCTYAEDDETAVALTLARLKEGWLCITMGAGNNRALNSRFLRSDW